MNLPVGLQPFTLRKELGEDFLGTLEKVAAIGYHGVEIGMQDSMTAAELKSELDRLGLAVIGTHTMPDTLNNKMDELIAFCQEVGTRYVILSWAPAESKAALEEAAVSYNRYGEQLKKHGIQFCYHNHGHELSTVFDGKCAMDILLEATDPDLMHMEMDTYWVKFGGVDPAEYLRKLKGRCPLVHVKDMEPGESRFFAEIGEGTIDFVDIAAIARDIGAEWLIVEQDECRRPPLESIQISYTNLRKLNLV